MKIGNLIVDADLLPDGYFNVKISHPSTSIKYDHITADRIGQLVTDSIKIVSGSCGNVKTSTAYTGKVSLTNPKRVPFCLSNDFDNSFELCEETKDCTSPEAFLKIAQKYHRYKAKMKIERDNTSYTRLSYVDAMGNIHYLIAYKEAV